MRVERSFAFLDLCGFTSCTSTRGDDYATRVLAGFRSAVREVASRRGVRIAKWLGDGAMIVSVEPGPLVAGVLEVAVRIGGDDSCLPIRAGMARGRVILFEGDDYIGTPVNLAARLSDLAGPGEVLSVPSLAACRPAWAAATEVASVAVTGFAAPVELVGLGCRPPGTQPVTDPICGLELPADAVVVPSSLGAGFGFCSDSCASEWADRRALDDETGPTPGGAGAPDRH